MNRTDFNYKLPKELIAQVPVYPRDSSRLLVYDKTTKEIEHKAFSDIVDYLNDGDLLVVNNTRVLPARLYGVKEITGGKIEILLSKRLNRRDWEVLVTPGRVAKIGAVFQFSKKLKGEIMEFTKDGRMMRFYFAGDFLDVISDIGVMPLPHYIKSELTDTERYQTVYSETPGSCAAPTAGLHFTSELIDKVKSKGVEICEVLLHVGLGTFKPVKVDDLESHDMHSEYYSINQATANKINKAKAEGRRVIAVGTTSVRVLESVADENGLLKEQSGNTKIFIYPPYKFKVVDAIITNFHLPESTLIMLVSAFCGRDETIKMYDIAVKERYRFFSFGDATFIK